MKAIVLLTTGLLLTSLAVVSEEADAQQARLDPIVLPPGCGALRPPVIAPVVPREVQGVLRQKNFNTIQQATDVFSWQSIIGLNWPAASGHRGRPDPDKPIGGPGLRVWETWKEEYEVYLPNGARPPGWNVFQGPASKLKLDAASRFLFRRHKIHDELDATLQAAGTRPDPPPTLTDQNGNLVRYEIRMNRVMFEFILRNELYNGLQQAAFGPVHFPSGAMILKAAWREIDEKEAGRYLTTRAFIGEKDDSGRLAKVRSRAKLMGLVGFHIMQKTPSAPQWIWSTFEHVDNVSGPNPSFFNPNTPDVPVNQQTVAGTPNQIKRLIPIPSKDPDCDQPNKAVDNIAALNAAVQKALAAQDTPLQYYELITTQWPYQEQLSPVQPTTVFDVLPRLSANTTMESFVQLTSSCMGCHSRAGTLDVNGFSSSDFTFTLNNANPKPANPWIIPPPREPVTDWDRAYWSLILNGQRLTEETYEANETKAFVRAKLHCASCHLNAGRDPNAAWWVGLVEKYDYPATTKLQDRINQCFRRSMNGKNLCSTDPVNEDCNTDAAMQSFLAYMIWIDNQFDYRLVGTKANGFPQIPRLTGDPERGSRIFLQKCAVCHGAYGQGRYYDGDNYFRPALWGPKSFNSHAGMNNPEKLSAFLKANMPLDAQGQLTAQEACDLAEFIDDQRRPAGNP
jgi:cytochrome c